jgi:hypothetical protein
VAPGANHLVAATSATAAGTSAGIAAASATAARTITATITTAVATTATKFLRARFIYLELAALYIKAIELSDGFGSVISLRQFDETEATGTAGFPVCDDARGADFVAFASEKLQQNFIGDAEREIAHIEFCHIFPLIRPIRANILPR